MGRLPRREFPLGFLDTKRVKKNASTRYKKHIYVNFWSSNYFANEQGYYFAPRSAHLRPSRSPVNAWGGFRKDAKKMKVYCEGLKREPFRGFWLSMMLRNPQVDCCNELLGVLVVVL